MRFCHQINPDDVFGTHNLGFYEKDERGEYRGWDHVDPIIGRGEYEYYIEGYACRLRRMHEDYLEMKCPNYWSRRLLLDKFDDWKDEWGSYPWYWGFEKLSLVLGL